MYYQTMPFYKYAFFKILWRHRNKIKTSVLLTILILRTCALLIDAKGATRLSFSVARAVCVSSVKFAKSHQINNPAQVSVVTNGPCKLLTWSQCNLGLSTTDAKCQNFKLDNCGPAIGSGTGTGPGEARRESKLKNGSAGKETRIMNGMDATPGEFPHLVSINKNKSYHCMGAILNENYIVTIANCVHKLTGKESIESLTVVGGEFDLNVEEGTEQVRQVQNIILHPQLNELTWENNVALVRMAAPLEFNELIYPPEFPQRGYDATGQLGTVGGWGATAYYPPAVTPADYVSPVLQKGSARVISLDDCKKVYKNDPWDIIYITPNTLCAGDGNDESRACVGDRGAPLSVKSQNGCNLLVGIWRRFGKECRNSRPGMYVSVAAYTDWFLQTAV